MTNKEIEQNYYIDVSNLEIGQIFKNIKEMSEHLRQPYLKGNSRVVQTNEWKRYIDWETKGQQITITEIYDTPLPKIDGRKTNGLQEYPSWEVYQVPKEHYKSKGVYAVILNKDIYVGSTTAGFLARYRQHTNPKNYLCTLGMLKQGAVFKSLWIADDNCTEEIIRQKESEFIGEYMRDDNWNVVNIRHQIHCTSHKGDMFCNGIKIQKPTNLTKVKSKHKIKKHPEDIRYIKIKHKHYDTAIELLKSKGLL